MQTIKTLQGQFFLLSNFAPTPVSFEGVLFPTVEHAFQAQKTHDNAERRRIASLPKPGQAKHAGKRVKLREDWEQVKVGIMKAILVAKFEQNAAARDVLYRTGDARIEEGNLWNDTFWGVSLKTGKGKNTLGLLLEEIRNTL